MTGHRVGHAEAVEDLPSDRDSINVASVKIGERSQHLKQFTEAIEIQKHDGDGQYYVRAGETDTQPGPPPAPFQRGIGLW